MFSTSHACYFFPCLCCLTGKNAVSPSPFSSVYPTTLILLLTNHTTGGVAGGLAGQVLYNARRRNLAIFMSLTTIAGVLPLLAIINANYDSVPLPVMAFVTFIGIS